MRNTFKVKVSGNVVSGLVQLIYQSWILITVWTLLIVSSLIWNIIEGKNDLLEKARIQARNDFDKDILYRRWNASHGGVYVPVTEKTPPNPYLPSTVERDVETLSGKRLTLVNPAYMTRQVHEMGKEKHGVAGHITSLQPIRPENKPDDWEQKALLRFEQGESEVSSLQIIEGKEYMRLMRPLFTEKPCMKCHAVQGYKEGDLRGGISVAIPMNPFRASSHDHIFTLYLVHFLFLLMGVIGIIASKVFITRSEKKQLQSEEKFRAYFEKAPLGYQSLDENGCFIDVNNAWLEIMQYSREEVIGRSVVDFLDPRHIEKFRKNFPCFKETGEIHGIEFEMVRKDGSHVIVSVNGKIAYDREGNFLQTHCLLQDDSERKKIEREREKLLAELERKNRELEQIVYVTSHDLRSPLLNIDGYSREVGRLLKELFAILEGDEVSEAVKDKVDSIVKKNIAIAENHISMSVIKMDALLSGLLQISRLGRIAIHKEPLDMNRLIGDISQTIAYEVEKAGAKLEVSELPSCTGDKNQIYQVFSNLIGNALKYLDPERSGRIRVSGKREGDDSVYCVEDNGIGISPGHQEKIFEIFYQLKPNESSGEGLGLTIVKKIIDIHYGKIWVESGPGRGSKFYVSLPNV